MNDVFRLSPIEGQPLLSYVNRLDITNLSMRLYEADKIEEVRLNNSSSEIDGMIFNGDCLSVCARLKEENTKVDLVYIDPPFASEANYSKKIHFRTGSKYKANQYNANTLEEMMYQDIWKKEDYLNWLYVRLVAIKEVMSENATIYVHLDWHMGHYVKIILDEIFGENNFLNEIIWYYRRWNIEGTKFASNHDTIFVYTKNKSDYIFNQLYINKSSKSSSQEKSWQSVIDENGVRRSVQTDAPTKGVPMPDAWSFDINESNFWEISMLNPVATERTGYATQKPEELIERIVAASSNEGNVVADFFGGSGVTAAVAKKMNRKFITADIGINSIQTMRDRLVSLNSNFDVYKVRDGLNLFRNPAQTEEKIFEIINGRKRAKNDSINKFFDGLIPDAVEGTMVPTKLITKEVLSEVYLDHIISIIEDMHLLDAHQQYALVYLYKDMGVTQHMINKKLKSRSIEGFSIFLISLEELSNNKTADVYSQDEAILTKNQKEEKIEVVLEKYYSPYLYHKVKEFNSKKKKETQKIKLSSNGYEFIESIQFDTTSEEKDSTWRSNKELEIFIETDEKLNTNRFSLPNSNFKIKIRNIAGDEIIILSSDIGSGN